MIQCEKFQVKSKELETLNSEQSLNDNEVDAMAASEETNEHTFFLLIAGPIDTLISTAIYLAPKESTIVYNNHSNIDITHIQKEYPEQMASIGRGLYVVFASSPQCDKIFCMKFGNNIRFFKTCSSEHCFCSNGQPHLQHCGYGTVFDPLHKTCNQPQIVGC
ncbi:unnamed protein product [Rotaria sp. Silwood1]|nr:unnamed protein product [Rotaria sp. Silwood1]CAF1456550.1 unnamed protein product [Rotaria sp. Silwood1]CAF1464436.1 unnamed protein product [Rotaria sp. Silwood1]CAF3654817.1 unnamed protein product [Rotaria sp. Silwood1]CAF3698535.1 unnamed protein product [Rotaria sp. Silwood1]